MRKIVNDSVEKPSKTQRKKEMHALQKLGEWLVKLSQTELDQIPLEPTLAKAIQTARILKSHGAIQRQLQYIGRLMGECDPKPIEEALDKIQLKTRQTKHQFHQAEQWRDRLMAGGDNELQVFLDQYPTTDRQQLRQIIRNAQQAKKGAVKELFRFLHENILPI
jgi:ribosome-associated protein